MATKTKTPNQTVAFHASNTAASSHLVGIGNLRVLITEDGESWVAHGLEIDYFADGETISEAQDAFQCGLKATIQEHLKLYGDISRLLVPAPTDVWQEFYSLKSCYVHSQVSGYETRPFSGITFIKAAA